MMIHWEVRTADRSTVVTGGNWLAAIGSATDNLGLEPLSLTRMVCDIQPDGLVQVRDPKSGMMLLVRHLDKDEVSAALRRTTPPDATETIEEPLFVVPPELQAQPQDEDLPPTDTEIAALPAQPTEAAPPPVMPPEVEDPAPTAEAPYPVEPAAPVPVPEPPRVAPAPRPADAAQSVSLDEETLADVEEPTLFEEPPAPELSLQSQVTLEQTFNKPIPDLQATGGFTQDDLDFFSTRTVMMDEEDDTAPHDLVEQLFDKCFDISMASDTYEAAQISLDILARFIEAESSAVLYASLNHTALEFLACTGPHAEEVRTMEVPFGQGIAGTVFDLGLSLIIRDATTDPRHLSKVDERTGYRTGPMLATVIRDDEGTMYGCIELMNPPRHFQDWHLDAAVTVAAALADFIRTRA